MLVGNVIFMNFIIAVVNESYTNCKKNVKAQAYMVKLDLIVQRESFMTEYELSNPCFFPNFIISRIPLHSSSSSGKSENERWQTLLGELNQGQEKIMCKNKAELWTVLEKQQAASEAALEQAKAEGKAANEAMAARMERLEGETREIKAMLKGIEQLLVSKK